MSCTEWFEALALVLQKLSWFNLHSLINEYWQRKKGNWGWRWIFLWVSEDSMNPVRLIPQSASTGKHWRPHSDFGGCQCWQWWRLGGSPSSPPPPLEMGKLRHGSLAAWHSSLQQQHGVTMGVSGENTPTYPGHIHGCADPHSDGTAGNLETNRQNPPKSPS